MSDYKQYMQQPGQWEWIDRETARLGSPEAFYAMRTAMQLQLAEIPEGMFMDTDRVKPENREMFVKICCEWLTLPLGENYYLNSKATRIYHERKIKLPLIPTITDEQK